MGLNMGNRLYDLMDWPSIEGVVYSECDEPMELLGGRICKDGFLIQTFAPDAVEMNVRVDGRKKLYPMEKMDDRNVCRRCLKFPKMAGVNIILINL